MKYISIRNSLILGCQERGHKYNKNLWLEQEKGPARLFVRPPCYNGRVIGILSDSHDNLAAVRRAVRLFNEAGCDLVLHAGDIVAPFTVLELRNLVCPVKAVFGNCDGEKKGLAAAFAGIGEVAEPPFAFVHAGRRFLLSHLPIPLGGRGRSPDFDVLVLGHTHKPQVRRNRGVLVINPGEAGGWLHGKSTAALLDPKGLSARIEVLKGEPVCL